MNIIIKISKIFLYIFLGLVVLLFIAGFFLEPIAKSMLEDQVADADEGQYSLTLDAVDISLLRGNFRLHGVRFETDTAHHDTPPIAFITANEIAAEGVSWLTFLLDDRMLIDEIRLDQFNVAVYAREQLDELEDEAQEDDPSPFRLQDLDIYPAIKDQVDRVRIQDLDFSDISLTLVNVTRQDTLDFNARELHLDSDDILIDADKMITEDRAFYATYMNFEGEDVDIRISGHQAMEAHMEFMRFASREQMMHILLKNMRFLDSGTHPGDTLMFASLDDFSMTNFDLKRLEVERTGHIENISLTGLHVINNQELEMDEEPGEEPEEEIDLAQLSFGEDMPEVMDRLELNELDIRHVYIRQGDMIRLDNFNLQVHHIVVDEEPAFAHNRFLHAEGVESSFELLAASMGEPMLHVNVGGFSMNIADGVGHIGFSEIQAIPEERPEDEMWFEAAIGPLNVLGLDTRNLTERELAIDSIAIGSPRILAQLPPDEEADEGEMEMEEPDLYPFIEDFLDRFSLNRFAVIGADIEVMGLGEAEESLRIPALYLQLRDIEIAEGTAFAANRMLHTESVSFRMENAFIPMPDGLYNLQLDLARFSTAARYVELSGLQYAYKENQRQRILEGEETNELYRVSNEQFRIDGIDFQQLIRDQHFHASVMSVRGMDVHVFKDHNYPEQEMEAENGEELPDPEEMDIRMHLGKFALQANNITYEEIPAGADTSGHAALSDFSLQVRNINSLHNTGGPRGLGLSIDSIQVETDRLFVDLDLEAMMEQEGEEEEAMAMGGEGQEEFEAPDLYPAIEDFMDRFRLGKLTVAFNDIEVKGLPEEFEAFMAEHREPVFYMHLMDVDIAPGTAYEEDRILHTRDIAFRLQDIALPMPDGVYSVALDNAAFSTGEGFVEVNELSYAYNDDYHKILEGEETNMVFRLSNEHFRIENMDFQTLIKDQGLVAEAITLEGLDVYVYQDENYPAAAPDDEPLAEQEDVEPDAQMPQEILRQLEQPIDLGRFELSGAHIIYEDMIEGADTSGVMELSDMFVKVVNITNREERLGENGEMRLDAGAKIMGDGIFRTTMIFDMLAPNNQVNIYGSVDSLDLTTLNQYTTYTTRLALRSGELHTLNWEIEADENNATGRMEMAYENLNIRISEGVGSDTTGVLKDIGAFLANSLILESDVPAEDPEEPEVVALEEERDEDQDFVSYYVETLMDGLLELMLTISFLL